MPIRLSFFARLVLLAWPLGFAAPAFAQDPEPENEPSAEPPAGAEAEAPAEYDRLIGEAVREAQEARWEEARALFRRAHDVYPNARTLRGIGMAAYQVQDYPDAVRSFRAALEDPRRPLTDAMRGEAQRQLDHALSFVGRYTLSEAPEGARVVVNGIDAIQEEDGSVLLPVGEHTVQVLGEDGQRWEGRWRVRGGEDQPIPIVFVQPVQPPPDRPEPPPPLPEPFDPTPAAALTIGGGVVLLTGVVLLIAGLVDVATVEGASALTRWDELEPAVDRAPVLTGTGFAFMGVGAAAVLAGSLWWGLGDTGPEPSAMLHLRGAF